MAYLRIHCKACGGKWEVYSRDNWKDSNARQCPHCFREIPRELWERDILPAFGEVRDANAELLKDHTGNRRPLFTFDVIADRVAQKRRALDDPELEKWRNCPNLD